MTEPQNEIETPFEWFLTVAIVLFMLCLVALVGRRGA
jgi:nitrate reductase NapE component